MSFQMKRVSENNQSKLDNQITKIHESIFKKYYKKKKINTRSFNDIIA